MSGTDGILLRDMLESDIVDYVRWFTTETGWMAYDAPWEECAATEEEERRAWTAYYESVRDLPPDALRQKFEIERNGKHIGWVSRYTDLEYMDNPDSLPAVGIDIPDPQERGRGAGTEALGQFIAYLRARGFRRIYTQTWSGNAAMLRTAEKLGFVPVCRLKGYRTVGGRPYDAVTLALDL